MCDQSPARPGSRVRAPMARSPRTASSSDPVPAGSVRAGHRRPDRRGGGHPAATPFRRTACRSRTRPVPSPHQEDTGRGFVQRAHMAVQLPVSFVAERRWPSPSVHRLPASATSGPAGARRLHGRAPEVSIARPLRCNLHADKPQPLPAADGRPRREQAPRRTGHPFCGPRVAPRLDAKGRQSFSRWYGIRPTAAVLRRRSTSARIVPRWFCRSRCRHLRGSTSGMRTITLRSRSSAEPR